MSRLTALYQEGRQYIVAGKDNQRLTVVFSNYSMRVHSPDETQTIPVDTGQYRCTIDDGIRFDIPRHIKGNQRIIFETNYPILRKELYLDKTPENAQDDIERLWIMVQNHILSPSEQSQQDLQEAVSKAKKTAAQNEPHNHELKNRLFEAETEILDSRYIPALMVLKKAHTAPHEQKPTVEL